MEKHVIVIGGGPAGMMAALTAAQAGAAVTLWERNDSLGKKLSITGKGRCNITNNAPTEELIKNLPGNGAFLHGAFSRFPAQATMDFFTSLGVELKTERGRRVFPLSDNARQVVQALQNRLQTAGVHIHYRRRAARLVIAKGRLSGVIDTRQKKQPATALVLATGGASYPATGSSGDGYKIAREVGHTIIEPRPALSPLETVETWPGQLAGLSLKNVVLSASYNEKRIGKEFGELLFTHFGLSGPIVLSLSRALTVLPDNGYLTRLALDLKPALSAQQLDKRLQRDLETASRQQVAHALSGLTPAVLLPLILSMAEIPATKFAHQLSRAERTKLADSLKNLPITVKGLRPLAEAIVTAGGIRVKEVNPKTMESKILPGLFLAGELLDIDGFSGGYNLQAAWASGYIAGQAAALYCNAKGGVSGKNLKSAKV